MLPLRLTNLLFILLFAQGWCKSTKTFTGQDYNDEVPPDYDDNYEDTEDDPTDNPPKIISTPVNIRVPVGSTFILPCNVVNADSLAVFWSRNGTLMKSDNTDFTEQPERIQVFDNHTLKIIDATFEDTSDNYNCSLSDRNHPSVIHKVFVYPRPKEDIILKPGGDMSYNYQKIHLTPGPEVPAEKGDNVTLGCYADLQPPPRMKWFHQSKRILEHSDKDLRTITLFKVTRHQAGFYQCIADNGSENPPHSAINLIVKYPPEVQVPQETVHSGLGIESKLTCSVYAYPFARVTWTKNGRVIDRDSSRTVIDDKSKHTLKILRTTDQDFGEYTCRATNEFGEGSKTITLTGAPSAPTIRGGELGSDDATIFLKWHLQSHSPITEYKLEYRRIGDDAWKVLKPQVMNGKENHYDVQHPIIGLEPGSYVAVLRARNSYGWSPPSDEHEFTGDYQAEGAESVTGLNAADSIVISTTLLYVLSLWILKNL